VPTPRPARAAAAALALAALLLAVFAAAPAGAILNGRPDGTDHPYVGLVTDLADDCSGFAISPTVVVTAAHCFAAPGQQVFVTFHPEGELSATFADDLVTGTWYPDPAFCLGCSPGLPGFDTHDVAVVVLDAPVTLPRYAQLPEPGLVDALPGGTRVESVGYGIQAPEREVGEDEVFARYAAVSDLSRARPAAFAAEFIKLSANPADGKGGACFGDSGGPNLLAGTDVVLGVTAYGPNPSCAGVSYAYRIDTAAALAFINQFL
jgi:hypothetical protein